jgi:hypothetical protein
MDDNDSGISIENGPTTEDFLATTEQLDKYARQEVLDLDRRPADELNPPWPRPSWASG